MNNLQYFIENFSHCPSCNNRLFIQIEQHTQYGMNNHSISLNQTSSSLSISISTDFFIHPNRAAFKFSLSINNGTITFSDSANDFLSLYDFSLILAKKCDQCTISGDMFLRQELVIAYDRAKKILQTEQMKETLFVIDKISMNAYYLFNDFKQQIAQISTSKSIVNIPYISLKDFNLNDFPGTLSKLNVITLLV